MAKLRCVRKGPILERSTIQGSSAMTGLAGPRKPVCGFSRRVSANQTLEEVPLRACYNRGHFTRVFHDAFSTRSLCLCDAAISGQRGQSRREWQARRAIVGSGTVQSRVDRQNDRLRAPKEPWVGHKRPGAPELLLCFWRRGRHRRELNVQGLQRLV